MSEATGWRAYALFTEASLKDMHLRPEALSAHEQIEAYEHLGEVLSGPGSTSPICRWLVAMIGVNRIYQNIPRLIAEEVAQA